VIGASDYASAADGLHAPGDRIPGTKRQSNAFKVDFRRAVAVQGHIASAAWVEFGTLPTLVGRSSIVLLKDRRALKPSCVYWTGVVGLLLTDSIERKRRNRRDKLDAASHKAHREARHQPSDSS